MTKCCPTCKRPFAPEVQLPGSRRQMLYDFIAGHPAGVTRKQILDYVWNDDPNGGPENFNIVAVMALHINRILEKRGLDIRIRGSGGPGSIYKVLW